MISFLLVAAASVSYEGLFGRARATDQELFSGYCLGVEEEQISHDQVFPKRQNTISPEDRTVKTL